MSGVGQSTENHGQHAGLQIFVFLVFFLSYPRVSPCLTFSLLSFWFSHVLRVAGFWCRSPWRRHMMSQLFCRARNAFLTSTCQSPMALKSSGRGVTMDCLLNSSWQRVVCRWFSCVSGTGVVLFCGVARCTPSERYTIRRLRWDEVLQCT